MSEHPKLPAPSPMSLGYRCFFWLPVVLWMALIFCLSSDRFSASNTGSILKRLLHWIAPKLSMESVDTIHLFIRKGAHVSIYAVLALLLMRAFRAGRTLFWHKRWAQKSSVVIAAYALGDEFHQAFTRSRGASIYDSLLDFAGGLVAITFLWLIQLWLNSRASASSHHARGQTS